MDAGVNFWHFGDSNWLAVTIGAGFALFVFGQLGIGQFVP